MRAPSKIIPLAFPGIRPAEVQELIANSKVNLIRRTVLCHEDADETVFYMILQGDVKVTKLVNQTGVRCTQNLYRGRFLRRDGVDP